MLRSPARALAVFALASVLGVVAQERPASACGGCFHGVAPTERTVVTGHRMAFSISTKQTVLWDQIQYSGDPREFAWVLPVQPGTTIEASYDEWFAALDASTQPQIIGPTPSGGGNSSGGGGCGCGSSADNALSASGGGPGHGEVQVITQQVVGPYESVTLRATDPQALETWLSQHGYDLPAAIKPTVDAYTSEGFDFIALRLLPGQGVRAMKPVRVITPGADASLPLRMVAAGVGANVGITLWILGEGRYEAQNFPNASIDDAKLVWSSSANRSNYEDLATSTMATANGRTWLTESAQPANLVRTGAGRRPGPYANIPGLADAYYGTCGARPPCTSAPISDAGDEGGDGSADAANDAANDASSDAGSTCPSMNGPSDCPWFDDLALATDGQHATNLWVTRVRAFLPAGALGAGDLRLTASSPQTQVTNVHYARTTTATGASIAARPVDTTASSVFLAGIFALITGAMLRKRK